MQLNNSDPIFYSQTRCGLNGRTSNYGCTVSDGKPKSRTDTERLPQGITAPFVLTRSLVRLRKFN